MKNEGAVLRKCPADCRSQLLTDWAGASQKKSRVSEAEAARGPHQAMLIHSLWFQWL